ncbi:hypothetical protein PV04_05452 [Phialophora macrospora]|uniref:Fibronectin type-III domain-containing protein n=1 Tax=Phialophora macrospora TaxID=1851006 RepID=A0A0D2E5G8_9EURO|nr:hypothetical protein PV04_05452 [Phialophora macrospora]
MRLLPSALALVVAVWPVAVLGSTPSKTTATGPHGHRHGHSKGTPTTTAFPETTSPAVQLQLQLQERDLDDICGEVSGTKVSCPQSQGVCVFGQSGGAVGCCPVDEYGYANSSCILVTDCVHRLQWLLATDTASLDPATMYCTEPGRPSCRTQTLYGTLTRPNGLVEPGHWTFYACGSTASTATGSVWTGGRPTETSTPDYDLLSQNMVATKPQSGQLIKGISDFVLNELPLAAGPPPHNWPQPPRALWDNPYTKYQESNPFNALAWSDKSDTDTVLRRLKEPELPAAVSVNMPIALNRNDSAIVLIHYPPANVDEDKRELVLSLWTYFWDRFAESMSRTSLRRRQSDGSDGEEDMEHEVPEIMSQTTLFNFIALNLNYFVRVRALESYSGTFQVVTSMVTATAEPHFTSFSTMVRISSFPGMADLSAAAATATSTATSTSTSTSASTTEPGSSRVTSTAQASRTCEDGTVLAATQECGAGPASHLSRLLWLVCFSLVAGAGAVWLW